MRETRPPFAIYTSRSLQSASFGLRCRDMSVACSYCGVSNGHRMIYMPCCLRYVHAFCHDLQLDLVRPSLGEVPECIVCRCPLTPRTVAEIRKQSHHKVVCAICCEDYFCDESFTDCDHYFHGLCLIKCLDSGHMYCPMCRKPIGDDGYVRLTDYRDRVRLQSFWNFLKSNCFQSLPASIRELFRYQIQKDYDGPFENVFPDGGLTHLEIVQQLSDTYSFCLTISERVLLRKIIRELAIA